MFILTNIDVNKDCVKILDTNDLTNDTVSLTALSKKIRGNRFKVYGLKRATNKQYNSDVIVIPQLGVVLDQREAREALARYYMQRGIDQNTAYRKVGLI